jgi:proteasome lid subunit RPN8/RPN11
MNLIVTSGQLRLLREEARRVQPIEACGLLFGESSEAVAAVERVSLTPNAMESNLGFEIDPKVFYYAFTEAEQDGLEFLGFFHSHPTCAYPSSVDRKFMKLWADAIWLILSLTENKFGAFQMDDARVQALDLRVKRKP